ncbi:hypothetical protein P692DRAFT_20834092 [Suillus brevipes Sb2]|nr:hypothetical protein P692DRAFT_20834092 [Suillus brevipes Sb2]
MGSPKANPSAAVCATSDRKLCTLMSPLIGLMVTSHAIMMARWDEFKEDGEYLCIQRNLERALR